jgi:ribosome biogenesis GTPase A
VSVRSGPKGNGKIKYAVLVFQEYLESIMEKYPPSDLSYFEINLETWRQLWRVLEISDIILLITDIRHPVSCVWLMLFTLHDEPSLLT